MRMEHGTVSKPLMFAVAAGVLALSAAGYAYGEYDRPQLLEIFVFSLKSGRSMLIRTPDDKRYLVDGGSGADIVRNISSVLPFYAKRIDGIIATGSEGKNIGGLIEALNRFEVGSVYIPRFTLESLSIASSTDKTYATLLSTANEIGIPIRELSAGDTVTLGKEVMLSLIFPFPPDLFEYSKASPPEALFRVSHGETAAVFLGNASTKVQRTINDSVLYPLSREYVDEAAKMEALRSAKATDVLIVSHSALPQNMSNDLIGLLRPQFLVYSKVVPIDPSRTASKKKVRPGSKTAAANTSKKKLVADPFVGIMDDHRFNIKEGSVRIASDGKEVRVESSN